MRVHFSHRRAFFECLDEFDQFKDRKPCWIHNGWTRSAIANTIKPMLWGVLCSLPFWWMLYLVSKGWVK